MYCVWLKCCGWMRMKLPKGKKKEISESVAKERSVYHFAENVFILFNLKKWPLFYVLNRSTYFSDSRAFINSVDVTGTVHEELTLTCSISLNCTKEADQCCIISYMFKDENTTVIYKKEFPNKTCERKIKATCVYKSSENMTAKFVIFPNKLWNKGDRICC